MDSCTTSARRRGFRRRLGSRGGVALCVLALAACSSVPDEINPVSWYDSIAGDEEVAQTEPAPGTEEEFPTLSSVPDEPAQTQSADDYAAVAEGLQADKANAQYTNETIRRADDEVEGSLPVPEPTVAAAEPEPEPEFIQPEPEPEPVAAAEPVVEPEPVVVPETTAVTTASAQAAQATQPAQATQGEDYSQYATVAEGLRAHSSSAPLPATSPVAAATTTATTTVQATATQVQATQVQAEQVQTAQVQTAQVQAVEQAQEPVPAQPLQSAQQATAVAQPVPAQPLPGTTVVSSTTQVAAPTVSTAQASTTQVAATTQAPAASQGSFTDMFNAAYQASAARVLPTSASASASTAAVVPAVVQPAAATVLPASYAPTARYHGARPTRLIASVMFADGSARLDAQARKTLLDVAYAYGATGGQILLVGHASGGGGSNAELANFDISLKRAVAVANELMRLQVTPENILVEAVGDNVPQVSLDMAGGAVNRRVDIYLGN